MKLVKYAWVVIIIFCAAVMQSYALASEYDFDHKVHYKQHKLDENSYRIEVIANSKIRFQRLSVFLLRHAYKVCGEYGYTLEILNGVEQIDDRQISPSYIQPNLSAKLICPKD